MLTNITIEQTKEILEQEIPDLRIEEVYILDSLDCVLAEDIISDMNIPPFDRSPLDGYAYRSQDTKVATKGLPVTLQVIDDIKAGYVSKKVLKEGQAIRIMTGAKVPEGADVIIKYEATEFTDYEVKIFESLGSGDNIVKMGEDISQGELVLSKGSIIGPAEIGILATLGKKTVRVYAKPKVAILATGDELVDIDQEVKDGKIRNSNSYMVAAQVKRLGINPTLLGSCNDDLEEVVPILEAALKWADIIITTGGASVGDADIIKDAFKILGAELLFWKVKVKPGSPIVAAKLANKLLFGLSGNPAAAYITFEQFVRPSLMRTMGKTKVKLMEVNTVLESDFSKKSSQNRYVRAFTYVKDGKYYTRLPDKHSSGVLSSLAGKNSIFFVPGSSGPYKKGDTIKIEFLDYIEVEE
ncbi:molybdopterin molybdotransferase MoeA [Tissierella creatinini]|nr:molybdopterin molybdotransferase MoeA [Tissierella creatinini]TJX66145.1 molybdopterin molybdotransferase MoeA [Soehngenia saccharolytica]